MNNNPFTIRSYSKSELAQLYRPEVQPQSAVKTLNNWIERNPALYEALIREGYCDNIKTLTPQHVALIVKHLGSP